MQRACEGRDCTSIIPAQGRDAAAIAQGMMRHLEQAADGAPKEADKARERDEQLRAPAHLLALLCSDSQPACWAAVQNGAICAVYEGVPNGVWTAAGSLHL